MEENTNAHYELVDSEHNIYQCSACGALERFEADGPYENGWDCCPHCGKTLVCSGLTPCGTRRKSRLAGHCRCGAELYGDEEICPDCKEKEEEP